MVASNGDAAAAGREGGGGAQGEASGDAAAGLRGADRPCARQWPDSGRSGGMYAQGGVPQGYLGSRDAGVAGEGGGGAGIGPIHGNGSGLSPAGGAPVYGSSAACCSGEQLGGTGLVEDVLDGVLHGAFTGDPGRAPGGLPPPVYRTGGGGASNGALWPPPAPPVPGASGGELAGRGMRTSNNNNNIVTPSPLDSGWLEDSRSGGRAGGPCGRPDQPAWSLEAETLALRARCKRMGEELERMDAQLSQRRHLGDDPGVRAGAQRSSAHLPHQVSEPNLQFRGYLR